MRAVAIHSDTFDSIKRVYVYVCVGQTQIPLIINTISYRWSQVKGQAHRTH